jgi:hypothetical protein
MSLQAESAGRFAHEALGSGPGEVMAVFRRSFYVRCAHERYACVGDASLGHGPLNVLVREFRALGLGERVAISLEGASLWIPPPRPGAQRRPRLPGGRHA